MLTLRSSFVGVKVILGVNLISYANRRRVGMAAREAEDAVNDYGRDPIGEGKEERVRLSLVLFSSSLQNLNGGIVKNYNNALKTLLDNKRDDVQPMPELGERTSAEGPPKSRRERVRLEDLTRFTMV